MKMLRRRSDGLEVGHSDYLDSRIYHAETNPGGEFDLIGDDGLPQSAAKEGADQRAGQRADEAADKRADQMGSQVGSKTYAEVKMKTEESKPTPESISLGPNDAKPGPNADWNSREVGVPQGAPVILDPKVDRTGTDVHAHSKADDAAAAKAKADAAKAKADADAAARRTGRKTD